MFLSRRQLLGHLGGAVVAAPAFAQSAREQFEPTPQEIVGPFYPLSKPADSDADLTMVAGRTGRAAGQIIEVSGRVIDRAGRPVSNAGLEIWQANAAGRYAHPSDDNPAPLDPNFQGYARLSTDMAGEYRIVTVKPRGLSRGTPRHAHAAHSFRSERACGSAGRTNVFSGRTAQRD